MSAWMASDDDFFMIRKFEGLGARVVLLMQNRIVQLEHELREEDNQCALERGNNGTFDTDRRKRRMEIMDELAERLERYRMYCSVLTDPHLPLLTTGREVCAGPLTDQSTA